MRLPARASGLAAASARVRNAARRPLLIGFAAETGSLERAAEKAVRKGVDLLVANDVAAPGSGFGSDTNAVTLIVPGGASEAWPLMPKRQVAERLLDRIFALRAAESAQFATR